MLKKYFCNIKKLFFFSLLLIILLPIISYSDFIVNTVYFRPTDAPPIEEMKHDIIRWMEETQERYKNEMERHGFPNKIYKYERLHNKQIKIHVVHGKRNSLYYNQNTFDKVIAELPIEIYSPGGPDFSWQDNSIVVLLGKTPSVEGVSGIGFNWSGGRYGGICVNAIETFDDFNKEINVIFHEMGHTFGSYHKSINYIGWDKLDHFEARWLSEHHLFNDDHGSRGWDGTLPRIIKQYDVIVKNEDIISIKFDVEGLNDLHQSMIVNNDSLVLGNYYFRGSKNETAVFDISRDLVNRNDTIIFQVMDKDGNYTWKYVPIEVPDFLEPVVENKNPDIGEEQMQQDEKDEKDEKSEKDEKGEELQISIYSKNKFITSWAKVKMRE